MFIILTVIKLGNKSNPAVTLAAFLRGKITAHEVSLLNDPTHSLRSPSMLILA
jgi:hypothetical protein